MIQLSIKKLYFGQEEKKQFFITNTSSIPVMFKIKTTNVQSVDILPAIGCIKEYQNFRIVVIRKMTNLKNVKLQINSVQCPETFQKQNFVGLWKKYGDKYIQYKKKISNANVQESLNLRKSQNQPLFQSLHLRHSQSLISSIKSDSGYSQDCVNSYQMQSSIQKLKLTKQKVQKSREINKKLKVELKKAQKFVKEIQRNQQLVYNQEHLQTCNHIHVSNKTLILFLLLLFCTGFLAGKQLLSKK